ncbi:MAG: heme-binding protein [Burkholderiales bacterium]|nr:heme-binding protein [Burkholderiales bacterium]
MKALSSVLLAVMLAVAALCARAQPYGLPITLEQARKVMAAAEAEARKNNWSMSIAIVDSGGHMVLFQRMDGSQFAGARIARDKAWSAAGYKRPGKIFQDRLAKGGEELRILQLHGVSAIDGGDPIVIDGKLIGGIGVSGGSGEQDGQVSKAGAGALK